MAMYAWHFDFSVSLLWTVENFLSGAECAAILDAQRDTAWLPATINGATGRVVDARVRSSSTAVVRDQPRTGRALLFQHMLLHSGERVLSGYKYVLRSDVIFGE